MSETRLVVREMGRDWSGTIHGSCADRAIAALSADPVTLDELEAAVARFAKPTPKHRFFCNLSEGSNDEPYDAGLVVIDLVARMIAVESTYSSPALDGNVHYHDGKCATDISVRYHLADDWRILRDRDAWRPVADERRRQRAAKPLLDVRGVFYGKPMLEFVGREVFKAFAWRNEIAAAVRAEWTECARKRLAEKANLAPEQIDTSLLTDEEITPKSWSGEEVFSSPFYATVKQIHAAWLLTPRKDLGDACPREIALERHGHLIWDLQDRCEQWSRMGNCPPGLAKASDAYQHGGFGTHELVKYYDLVRELLWSCWKQITEMAQTPNVGNRFEMLTVGDFLTTEVPRLEKVRDEWFDVSDNEFHGRTPRSIIERERARLPEGVSGHEAMVDPDCPCCQMMGEISGPFFWHLDGSGMDDEFAFDIYHRTREEWDEERRRWDEHARRFNEEQAECKRLGVSNSKLNADGSPAVWTRSFNVANTADVPLGIRVFGVGCRLAEIIVGLRGGADRENTPKEAQQYIDRLNRDFGNLRDVLQNADSSLAEALIDPVRDRFAESLSEVNLAYPDLAERCEALTDEIRQLLDPPSPAPAWDPGDPEIPF